MEDPPTVQDVRCLIEPLLGVATRDIELYQPPVGGDDSHSFTFSAAGERLLLKVKKRRHSPIGLYFYERIRDAGIPVPELVAFSPTAGPDGQACAIWSWMEGRPAEWQPGEPCPYDEAEFGSLLRRIHDLRFDGPFGLLGDDLAHRTFTSHPDLRPVSQTWEGFFDCESAARRYRDRGYLSQGESEALSRLATVLAPLFATVEARLLHLGDIMHQGNMLLDPEGHIIAVLDYVESTAGDPRWELSWVDFYFADYPCWRPAFDLRRFRAGYGTDHNSCDEVGRFYLLAILLFEKLLFFDPDSPRGQWAIGTAKRLLATFR
jgi:aminoglycoside phosphotransferase (APT) family kinase protein